MNAMTNHSSRGLAVAPIAAPVVWVVTELISPAMEASPEQQLEIIAGDPGRWALTMALVVPRWAGPLLAVSLAANLFSWSASNVLAIGLTAAVAVVAVVPVALSRTRDPAPSLVAA